MNGKPHGKGHIDFNEKSACFVKQQVKKLIGNFEDGLLEGLATIQFENKTQQAAHFHKGFLSGLSRIFQCQFEFCDFDGPPSWNIPNWLAEVSFVYK